MTERDQRQELSRRTFNRRLIKGIAGAVVAATGISLLLGEDPTVQTSPIKEPTPMATATPEKMPFSEEAIRKHALNILNSFPVEDENIIKLYRGGKIQDFNYHINGIDLNFYALPCSLRQIPPDCVCDVDILIDSNVINTLEDPFIHSTIGLSQEWYEMNTPEAQMITLEYAANTVLQTPRFNRYQYLSQAGKETPQQFQNPFLEPIYMARNGIALLETEPYNTIHKSAPLIQVLQHYESLDPEAIDMKRDLDLIISSEFRQFIYDRNIPWDAPPTTSSEYDEFVFGTESPWVQAIMEWNELTI